MRGHVTGEESRTHYVAKMGTDLGEISCGLSSQLACAHFCWTDYQALYANPQTIDFLEVASVNGSTEGWRAAQKSLPLCDTDSQPQRFIESEWAHAGALNYEI